MQKLLLILSVVGIAVAIQVQRSHKQPSHSKMADEHLLETGGPMKLDVRAIDPKEIKVVSYNIRWRSGDDLRSLAKLLRADEEIGGAAIIGLQEVDRNRKRTGNANTAKWLANELGMNYAWAAPPHPKADKEEETGVLVMSPYPISEVHRIVLPHEGPNGRRRVGVGATVKVGQTKVRVYSLHCETRLSMDKKLEQMNSVIKDLEKYPKEMPVIIMGDLNTWEPGAADKTRKLFTDEGFQTPFDTDSTFSRWVLMVPIKMKLDWIWLRNLESGKAGIDKEISLSDHWPLWVSVKLKSL